MQFTVAMTSVVTSARPGISCLDAGTSPRNIQRVHCTFGGRAHGERLQLVSPQRPRLHLCGRSHKLSLFQVSDNDLKQFGSGGSVCNSLVEKKILPQIVCIKISDVCYEETVSYPSASNVVTLYMVVPGNPSISVLTADAIVAVEGRIDLCILIIPWGVLSLWRQSCRFRKATLSEWHLNLFKCFQIPPHWQNDLGDHMAPIIVNKGIKWNDYNQECRIMQLIRGSEPEASL